MRASTLVVSILAAGNLKEDRAIIDFSKIVLVDDAIFCDEQVGQNPFDESGHWKGSDAQRCAVSLKFQLSAGRLTIPSLGWCQ